MSKCKCVKVPPIGTFGTVCVWCGNVRPTASEVMRQAHDELHHVCIEQGDTRASDMFEKFLPDDWEAMSDD